MPPGRLVIGTVVMEDRKATLTAVAFGAQTSKVVP
jgi:hypothetical protein